MVFATFSRKTQRFSLPRESGVSGRFLQKRQRSPITHCLLMGIDLLVHGSSSTIVVLAVPNLERGQNI